VHLPLSVFFLILLNFHIPANNRAVSLPSFLLLHSVEHMTLYPISLSMAKNAKVSNDRQAISEPAQSVERGTGSPV
jgi:hypothetical protein